MSEQLQKDIAVALAAKNGDASTAKELIDIIVALQAAVIDLQAQIDAL